MTNQNQLTKIHTNINDLIKSKSDAMPKDFNETRFIQNAMTVLADTANLEKMEPQSVARTILKGAFLGLDFVLMECYAIPYGDKLQFQTDYRGEVKLAKKYSIRPVMEIYAKIVRVGDAFEETIKDGLPSINFKPKPFNEGQIAGVFAVCLFKDGGLLYETMNTAEINHVRNKFSKMKDGKAWLDSWGEMAKKTVLRRLCKYIPKQLDSIEAGEAFEEGADAEFADFEEVTEEPIKMPAETQTETNNGKEGDQLAKMLELLHGEKVGEWLELQTSFTTKDTEQPDGTIIKGRFVAGKRNLDKLTEKQKPFVFRAARKELIEKAERTAIEVYPDSAEREKALAGMADGVFDIAGMNTATQVEVYEILLNLKLDKEAKATEAK